MKPSIKLIWYFFGNFSRPVPNSDPLSYYPNISPAIWPNFEFGRKCPLFRGLLYSIMWLAFCKLHKHQWPRIPLPALFSHSDLSSLNCLLSPMCSFTQLKLSGNPLLMVPGENTILGEREAPFLWASRVTIPWDARVVLGSTQVRKEHVSCFVGEPQSSLACTQTVLNFLMKTAPLAFFLSHLSAWGGGQITTMGPWFSASFSLSLSLFLPKATATLPAMLSSQKRSCACHFM